MTWECEHCNEPQTGDPAAKDRYAGDVELWFCEGCTQPQGTQGNSGP